jgi:uncharacterized membrane protein required for colicin V production
MLLNLVLLVVIFATAAMLFRDGLWGNAITLVNVVIAGLIAVNYFEPATRYLSSVVPYMDYNLDVMVFGAMFGAVYAALRYIGLQVSQHTVRFHPIADQIGGGLLSLATGWVLVCLIVFAMHMSPMSRVYFFEGFQPEKEMFFGLAPDRNWLGFVSRQSTGSLGSNVVDAEGNVTSQFDPKGDFMLRYASRRTYLEKRNDAFAPAAGS